MNNPIVEVTSTWTDNPTVEGTSISRQAIPTVIGDVTYPSDFSPSREQLPRRNTLPQLHSPAPSHGSNDSKASTKGIFNRTPGRRD